MSSPSLGAALRNEGLVLMIGPFLVHLRSRIPAVARSIALHYSLVARTGDTEFADFRIQIQAGKGLRRWIGPQAIFYLDDVSPFRPLPLPHAFALLEWGLNWCIAQHAHRYLQLHAAVLEREGKALILPGTPGSGKSTLCAALLASGWRLLSDEFALIDRATGMLQPIPRPVGLKNDSIDLIRRFAPHLPLGEPAYDTDKGTVAHVQPPADSLARREELARPAWIVFPTFSADSPLRLEPLSKGRALMRVADSSFNYNVLGAEGFRAAGDLVDSCSSFTLSYSRFEEAIATIEALDAEG